MLFPKFVFKYNQLMNAMMEQQKPVNKQDQQRPPPLVSFLPVTLVLIVIGWGGLYYILTETAPSGGTRWVMFFCSVLAITGTFLPVAAFLNRRFPSTPPPSAFVVLRQAIWVGIYIPSLVWLQIGRVLTPTIALLLALGMILIEWLLRLRERSQRR